MRARVRNRFPRSIAVLVALFVFTACSGGGGEPAAPDPDPPPPADHVPAQASGSDEGLLYAGTERGAYYSENGGRNWQPLQLNLPITPITDLQVRGDDLVEALSNAMMVLAHKS